MTDLAPHLALIVFGFIRGAVSGCVFYFLWEINRAAKIILFALCVAAVGVVLLDVSGYIASFGVWYAELSILAGIMVGRRAGKQIGKAPGA